MSNRSGEIYSLSEDYLRTRRREEDEWADLAAEIVLFAFKELVDVLYKLIISPGTGSKKQLDAKKELEERKSEILLFFKSAWYEALTAINADWVIKEAQEQAIVKAIKHLERQTVRQLAREQHEMEEML